MSNRFAWTAKESRSNCIYQNFKDWSFLGVFPSQMRPVSSNNLYHVWIEFFFVVIPFQKQQEISLTLLSRTWSLKNAAHRLFELERPFWELATHANSSDAICTLCSTIFKVHFFYFSITFSFSAVTIVIVHIRVYVLYYLGDLNVDGKIILKILLHLAYIGSEDVRWPKTETKSRTLKFRWWAFRLDDSKKYLEQLNSH